MTKPYTPKPKSDARTVHKTIRLPLPLADYIAARAKQEDTRETEAILRSLVEASNAYLMMTELTKEVCKEGLANLPPVQELTTITDIVVEETKLPNPMGGSL